MLPVWANAQEKTPCACMVNNIGNTCPVNMIQVSLILLTNHFRLPLRNKLFGWLRWLRQSCMRLSGELIGWLPLVNIIRKLNFTIKVVEENQEWNRCIDENSLKLGRCVYNCQSNQQCEDDCLSRFKTRQLDCPCEVIFRKNNKKIVEKFRKIVWPDVLVAVSIVLRLHRFLKWQRLLFLLPQHHKMEMRFFFWVLTIWITNLPLLISTVNITNFLRNWIPSVFRKY